METAEIVKIAVSAAPYSIDKPYDYLVPPEKTYVWHCGCGSGTSARCLRR